GGAAREGVVGSVRGALRMARTQRGRTEICVVGPDEGFPRVARSRGGPTPTRGCPRSQRQRPMDRPAVERGRVGPSSGRGDVTLGKRVAPQPPERAGRPWLHHVCERTLEWFT